MSGETPNWLTADTKGNLPPLYPADSGQVPNLPANLEDQTTLMAMAKWLRTYTNNVHMTFANHYEGFPNAAILFGPGYFFHAHFTHFASGQNIIHGNTIRFAVAQNINDDSDLGLSQLLEDFDNEGIGANEYAIFVANQAEWNKVRGIQPPILTTEDYDVYHYTIWSNNSEIGQVKKPITVTAFKKLPHVQVVAEAYKNPHETSPNGLITTIGDEKPSVEPDHFQSNPPSNN